MKNTDYFCPECHVESKDTIVNPIQNPDIIFCPECGWLIDHDVLEMQPNLKVKWNLAFPDRTKASQDIVDLLEQHGFGGYGTGGGCMAMTKDYDDGTVCMITDNDASLDNLDDEIIIGFETEDGDPIEKDETYNNSFHHSADNSIIAEINRLRQNI